jgi:hypothetical protein
LVCSSCRRAAVRAFCTPAYAKAAAVANAPTAPTKVPIGLMVVALAEYHCHAARTQDTHTTLPAFDFEEAECNPFCEVTRVPC